MELRLSLCCLPFAFIASNVLFIYVLCLSAVPLFIHVFIYVTVYGYDMYIYGIHINIYMLLCYLCQYACLIICLFASFVDCYVFRKISSGLNNSIELMFYVVFANTFVYASDFQ
jgi:hypothetical protein